MSCEISHDIMFEALEALVEKKQDEINCLLLDIDAVHFIWTPFVDHYVKTVGVEGAKEFFRGVITHGTSLEQVMRFIDDLYD